jgi:hypothetical protein
MTSLVKFHKFFLALFLLLIATIPFFLVQRYQASAHTAQRTASTTLHYLYVVPDQSINVYDIDNGFSLVKSISMPNLVGVRGVVQYGSNKKKVRRERQEAFQMAQ